LIAREKLSIRKPVRSRFTVWPAWFYFENKLQVGAAGGRVSLMDARQAFCFGNIGAGDDGVMMSNGECVI